MLYYRLIALWVICEAFAGGIMHALKIPFTGMLVSSLAVLCIIFLGFRFSGKGKILKAALLVCAFKFTLSPHSPPTAYIAVLFQATAGSLLFSLPRFKTAAAILLGMVALTESALQRLLVLWVLYGKSFWNAVDQYVEKLSGNHSNGSATLTLAGIYIGLHFIVGTLVGAFGASLAKRNFMLEDKYIIAWEDTTLPQKKKKRKKAKWIFIIVWLLLLVFIIFGYANPDKAVISGGSALMISFRVILIITAWYFFISPQVKRWLSKRWEHTRSTQADAYRLITELIPSTFNLIKKSAQLSASKKGLSRLKLFIHIVLGNIFLE